MIIKLQAGILTIIGGFLLPYSIRMTWDRMVNKLGAVGGFLAALTVVGTIWILDHGMKLHLIHQSGKVWIDMAWAAGIGAYTYSLVMGGNIKKSVPNLIAAVLGGVFAGFILTK